MKKHQTCKVSSVSFLADKPILDNNSIASGS